jgi:hypothetical protein
MSITGIGVKLEILVWPSASGAGHADDSKNGVSPFGIKRLRDA